MVDYPYSLVLQKSQIVEVRSQFCGVGRVLHDQVRPPRGIPH